MEDDYERQEEEWYATVHTKRLGPYPDRGSAFAAARAQKRQSPNLHVAVVDPRGHSTPVD